MITIKHCNTIINTLNDRFHVVSLWYRFLGLTILRLISSFSQIFPIFSFHFLFPSLIIPFFHSFYLFFCLENVPLPFLGSNEFPNQNFRQIRQGDLYFWSLWSDIQRNWVFVTNSDFLIPISLQPNVVDLRYFKLWILLDQIM